MSGAIPPLLNTPTWRGAQLKTQGTSRFLLHFTSVYFTLLYFALLCFTLLYFTLLYFTLVHFTSLHFNI